MKYYIYIKNLAILKRLKCRKQSPAAEKFQHLEADYNKIMFVIS